MALLLDDEAAQLGELFDRELTGDVTLVHFTQQASPPVASDETPCSSCADAKALLGELAATSDHVALEIHELAGEPALAREYGIDKVPATVITGARSARRGAALRPALGV